MGDHLMFIPLAERSDTSNTQLSKSAVKYLCIHEIEHKGVMKNISLEVFSHNHICDKSYSV